MKKLLAIILCVLLTGTLFVGCNEATTDGADVNNSGASEVDKEGTKESKDQKLVIWEHAPNFEPSLVSVIEGFNEKNPDVEIEYQIKTNDQYYNLLATTIQAGEAPDLFWTNGMSTNNYTSYIEQDVLMDLTDKVDFSLFTENMMDIVINTDGKVYASPTAVVDGRAVYYNKDVFAELGLSVPKTFSEFEALLPIIHAADIIPIAFANDSWNTLFQFEPILAAMSLDWLLEAEEGDVNVNDVRVADAYNKMIEWADKGYYGPGFTGVEGSSALLALSKGDAAMTINGTWNTLTIRENNPDMNLGAFHIPTESGEIPFVATAATGFSVSKNTQSPEAAIDFMNYFASVDGQTRWVNAMQGISGVAEVKSDDPVLNEIGTYDVWALSFHTIMTQQALEGQKPGTVWEEDQPKVLTKGITAEEFLDSIATMCRPAK